MASGGPTTGPPLFSDLKTYNSKALDPLVSLTGAVGVCFLLSSEVPGGLRVLEGVMAFCWVQGLADVG